MHTKTDDVKSEKYLKYGYYWANSALRRKPLWLNSYYQGRYEQAVYTPKEVQDLLRRILCEHLQEVQPSGYCVIPLSGGLDSRILLGEALHHLPKRQVKTVTFGNPRQLDYDLGRETARAVGVENVTVQLDSVHINWEAITNSARKSPWTYLPDSFFNEHARALAAGHNDIILSGFLGDPTTGGHLPTGDPVEVLQSFFRQQRRGSKIYRAQHDQSVDTPTSESLAFKTSNSELLSLFLDLEIRQRFCIAPITTGIDSLGDWSCDVGRCQTTGAMVKAPFAAPEWIAYWYGAPSSSKHNQSLYRSFLSMAHPILDSVGSKENLGAHSRRSMKYYAMLLWLGSKFMLDKTQNRKTFFREKLNYVDYKQKFRYSDDYREILKKSSQTLLDAGLISETSYEQRVLADPKCIDPETALVLIGCAANVAVHDN